jgi:hypothetical protein
MQIHKKYLIKFALGFSLFWVLIPCANLVVDPFWIYRLFEIKGLNVVKPEFVYYEREAKPAILKIEKPITVILGSSYSEIGLDPLHPSISKGYNFGMIGAEWSEIMCNYCYALEQLPDLKHVILGVGIGNMGIADCSEKIKQMESLDHVKMLFSITSLKSSILTLLQQDDSKATHTKEGLFFYTKRDSSVWNRFAGQLHIDLNNIPKTDQRLKRSKDNTWNYDGLVYIINQAFKRDIKITIIVHPSHAYTYEVSTNMIYNTWQRIWKITDSVEKATPKNKRVPVWVFAGYNKYTAETVPRNKTMQYWQDTGHYNKEFGDLMLNRILGDTDENKSFGFIATTENIVNMYNRFLNERILFIKNHPEFLENLRELSS